MPKSISCLIVDDEAIARDIIASLVSKIESINIIATCDSAIDAFKYINTQKIDLIFLDINMPDITGIAFAKSINTNIKVIFTTAYRDYAVEGFELQAVDYLMKPISFERLLKSVNNYFEIYNKPEISIKNESVEKVDFIFVRSNRQMLKIDFNEIVYIESLSDYIKIHLNDSAIVTRETISAIEGKLPANQFIRIHRSYIVSLKHINNYTNEYITINKSSLPISRSYKKNTIHFLESYQ